MGPIFAFCSIFKVAVDNWGTKPYKNRVSFKHICMCISSLVNKSLQLILFIILMLMFKDMLTVYSGHSATFSNFSLKSAIFTSFTISLTMTVYFQLPWFLKGAVAKALKLQKMTVAFRHMYFTGQIFDTGFRGDIFCF